MPHIELCEPCHHAIMGAANGETLTLCQACQNKGDAAHMTVYHRAMIRGEVLDLKFDPPLKLIKVPADVSWRVLLITAVLVIAGIALLLYTWPTPAN